MTLRQVFREDGTIERIESIPDPPAAQLTPLEIVELFNPTELLAIEQSTNLAIVATRAQIFAATVAISLDDPRFTGVIQIIEAAGILTPERAAAVLHGIKV